MNTATSTVTLLGFLALSQLGFAAPAWAQNGKDGRADFVVALNEGNIRAFLQETGEISTGQRPGMTDDDVTDYFTNHLADKGEFSSTITYEIPGFPNRDVEVKLDKENYTSTVVTSRNMLDDYRTNVSVSDLKIGSGGKSATFKSITKEKGRMPWAKDPENSTETEMIPVQGESICEQRLIVSYNNFIQMASAACKTRISFDPFGGKALVP